MSVGFSIIFSGYTSLLHGSTSHALSRVSGFGMSQSLFRVLSWIAFHSRYARVQDGLLSLSTLSKYWRIRN